MSRLRVSGGALAAILLISASLVVVRDWRGESLLRRGKELAEARDDRGEELLVKSLAHGNADAALELARLSFGRQEWQKVYLYTDEALSRNPYLPYAYILKAYALAEEKPPATTEDAEGILAVCDSAVEKEPAGSAWWRSCAELSLRLYRQVYPGGGTKEESLVLRTAALEFHRKALALGGREAADVVRAAAAPGPEALFLVEGLVEAPYPAIRETVRVLLEGDVWWAVRSAYWEMAGSAELPRDYYRGAVDALREMKRYREVLTALDGYDMREKEDAALAWTAALSAEALGPDSDAWPLAEKYYRTAVALAGDRRGYRKRLGTHLFRLQKLEEAENVFRELTDEDPRDHQAWFYLGEISMRKGDKGKAAGYYRKALNLKPGNRQYEKSLKKAGK